MNKLAIIGGAVFIVLKELKMKNGYQSVLLGESLQMKF
jgi:hypothetical protein